MKLDIKAVMLILILFVLVGGFSIVPYFQQAFSFGTNGSSGQLPEGNIVGHELTEQQEILLLQQGKVVMRYEHNVTCESCEELKLLLEQIVNSPEFKDSVVLTEFESANAPRLNVVGFNVTFNRVDIGQRIMKSENITQEKILDSLCLLMLKPPVGCALRNV